MKAVDAPAIGPYAPGGRIHGWQVSPRTEEFAPLCQGGDQHYEGAPSNYRVALILVERVAEITCRRCQKVIVADQKRRDNDGRRRRLRILDVSWEERLRQFYEVTSRRTE